MIGFIQNLLAGGKTKSIAPALFNYTPNNVIRIDSAAYLRLYKSNPDMLKHAKLIPPVIGEEDFGGFEITLNHINDLGIED